MAHICVNDLGYHVPDNGLSLHRRRVIIWTNALLFVTGPLGINCNEILMEIQILSAQNSFRSVVYKMAVIMYRPQCVDTNSTQLLTGYHRIISMPVPEIIAKCCVLRTAIFGMLAQHLHHYHLFVLLSCNSGNDNALAGQWFLQPINISLLVHMC